MLPLVLAGVLALWWRRQRRTDAGPSRFGGDAVVGLVAACLGARLVFEVGLFNYYFLATGVLLLLVDTACARPPWRSVSWVVATRFGLDALTPHGPSWLTASCVALAAVGAVWFGVGTGAAGKRLYAMEPTGARTAPAA